MSRSILITGTSRGLGAATMHILIERGYRVFGTVRSTKDGDRIRAGGAEPVILDLTSTASIKAAYRHVTDALSGEGLWGLVNNAGIPAMGPMELIPIEQMRAAFDVNLFGLVELTQTFLPLVKATKGHIINIGSVSGFTALPFAGPYAATKFALEAVSDSMRRELIPAGVRVTLVQPGSCNTDIWNKIEKLNLEFLRGTVYEGVAEPVRQRVIASGRNGIPAKRVAQAILKVLESAHPPTRVLVVRSRFKTRLMRLLPDKAVDRLIARTLWREIAR